MECPSVASSSKFEDNLTFDWVTDFINNFWATFAKREATSSPWHSLAHRPTMRR